MCVYIYIYICIYMIPKEDHGGVHWLVKFARQF